MDGEELKTPPCHIAAIASLWYHETVRTFDRILLRQAKKPTKPRIKASRISVSRKAHPGVCVSCTTFKWLPIKSKCSSCYYKEYYRKQKQNGTYKPRLFKRNKAKDKIRAKAYYLANRETLLTKKKTWRALPENRIKDLEYSRAYDKSEARKRSKTKYKASPKYKAKQRRYFDSLDRATPAWADKQAIKRFYQTCPKHFSVDHIIPLNGATVSGLHVIQNLQYLSRSANSQKRNSFKG